MEEIVMATYALRTTECHIAQIRSPQSDSLYATSAVRVMNAEGGLHHDWPAKSVALGDHGRGERVAINLSLDGIDVPDATAESPDGGAIYWSFLLVNKGQADWSVLLSAL